MCRGLVSSGAEGWTSCLIKHTQLCGPRTNWCDEEPDESACDDVNEVGRSLYSIAYFGVQTWSSALSFSALLTVQIWQES